MPQAYAYHTIIFAVVSILIWSLEDWFFITILLAAPFVTEVIQFNLGVGKFDMMDIAHDYLGIFTGYCVVALWGEIKPLRMAIKKRRSNSEIN